MSLLLGSGVVGIVIAVIVGLFVCLPLIGFVFTRFYIKVEQGRALIVNKMRGEPLVTFTGALVMPVLDKAEVMDVSVKTIDIDRRGHEGLICKDNIRADIRVTFFVRVNNTTNDVLKVAQAIGCQRASDQEVIEVLFAAKFSEALKTVGKQMDFVELYTRREQFRDEIIKVIGQDLNGYALEDAAIDYLEQTPVESLDRNNILDAQGIRKITELTTVQHIETNKAQNEAQKRIKAQDVERSERILELERQEEDARAEQKRAVEIKRAQEQSSTMVAQAQERSKAEEARIKMEEKLAIEEENKRREIEVAQKNRERVIGIEHERVERDRMLEVIARERETELQRIAKERALEEERKAIQEVIRERIAVERTVAEEEERIKTLRVVEEANRIRDAAVISAEGEAQEGVVRDVKAAEASEQVSRLKAKEQLTLAEAELTVADKSAQAKIRLSEGIQAEEAAAGLAAARVKEANALAQEKEGLAAARIKEANAMAEEKEGMAEVRVKEAAAPANEKLGMAEVNVERARHEADADAIRLKLEAEASGLAKKAESMKLLDEVTRDHEEFRLKLESDRIIALEGIKVQKEIAEAQAMVMSEAFRSANIDIIGGDGAFVDKIFQAASLGKSLDHFVNNGETGRALAGDYLNGERSFARDLKEVLSSISAGEVKNLTLSAFLGSLMNQSDAAGQAKVKKLLDAAQALGMGDLNIAPDKPPAPKKVLPPVAKQ
ncbi:MAG: hypothetical protein HY319_08365 [Armatimonadetes bacterium]|nr:hypothetical protein [Armatimonadota bacterium]